MLCQPGLRSPPPPNLSQKDLSLALLPALELGPSPGWQAENVPRGVLSASQIPCEAPGLFSHILSKVRRVQEQADACLEG